MSTAATEAQQQSKVLDPAYDTSKVLETSALASKYCYERGLIDGVSCWKMCRIYSDLARCASTTILAVGLPDQAKTGVTDDAAKSAAAGGEVSTAKDGGEAAGDGTGTSVPLSGHCLAVAQIDVQPLLRMVVDVAGKVKAECGGHEQAHCKHCAESADRVVSALSGAIGESAAASSSAAIATPESAEKPQPMEGVQEEEGAAESGAAPAKAAKGRSAAKAAKATSSPTAKRKRGSGKAAAAVEAREE